MKTAAKAAACLAGCLGAAGVAAGAAAAHSGGGGNLGTASHYLLIHAAAALALIAISQKSNTFLVSAWILLAGAALFGGDLALRALAGIKLFPMAAPAGGLLMIAGWLTAGCGAVLVPGVAKGGD